MRKIKVGIKRTHKTAWYHNRVGETFIVERHKNKELFTIVEGACKGMNIRRVSCDVIDGLGQMYIEF